MLLEPCEPPCDPPPCEPPPDECGIIYPSLIPLLFGYHCVKDQIFASVVDELMRVSLRAIMNHAGLNGFFRVIEKDLSLAFEYKDHLAAVFMLVIADR